MGHMEDVQPIWETMLALIEMDEDALIKAKAHLTSMLDMPTPSANALDEGIDRVLEAFQTVQTLQANIDGAKLVLKTGERGDG